MVRAQSAETSEVRNVVAGRSVTMRGVDYAPGDPVDVSGLPDHKVSQMLNLRILRPATPATSAPVSNKTTG